MGAFAGSIEFFHLSPNAPAILVNRHLVSRHSLVRDVDDVLGIVEEGHVVVVAADQQDLATELHEPIEGRVAAEGVVPRLIRYQVAGMLPPDDEACHVRVDHRTGIRAKELDEHSVVARGSCGDRIESRQLLDQLTLLVRGEVSASDFVVVPGTVGVHHQRPLSSHGILEREVDLIGPTSNVARGAYGGMHHERVAGSNAQAAESIRQFLS